MRIRNGFVSNSSSASFVLNIHISRKELNNILTQLSVFSIENMRNYFKDKEKSLKKYIIESQDKKSFFDSESYWKQQLKQLDPVLKVIDKEMLYHKKQNKLINYFMRYKGFTVKNKQNCITIASDTVCYNGPEEIDEIYLILIGFLSTFTKHKYNFNIIDTH